MDMGDTESETLLLRGYRLTLSFQPKVKLLREKGFAFAQKLSSFMTITQADIKPERWVFVQQEGEDPRGHLSVQLTPELLQLEAAFPTQRAEWHELKRDAVLEAFSEMFKPAALVRTVALVACVLPLEVDAREFLASEIMAISKGRLRHIGRPIHVVGLRLGCPPFQKKSGDEVEVLPSSLEVKIESLAEDPTKLFLEAAVDWPMPTEWNENARKMAQQRLGEVRKYLEENLLPMVRAEQEGSDDD